jgi:hypothetical protein
MARARRVYRQKDWQLRGVPGSPIIHTCSRPGRRDFERERVPKHVVDEWVRALPEVPLTIVSLLGWKETPDGESEYELYDFCGANDRPDDQRGKPTFQEWLSKHHVKRDIIVVEHPTIDYTRVPDEVIAAVGETIRTQLATGRTVYIMDSGGVQRTGRVCDALGYVSADGYTGQ